MGSGLMTKQLPLHHVVLINCSFVLVLILLTNIGSAATTPKLHQDEVRALRAIGKRLGKRDWDFNKDPCCGEGNWSVPLARKGFESSVTCDCSFDRNSTCHVVSIRACPNF